MLCADVIRHSPEARWLRGFTHLARHIAAGLRVSDAILDGEVVATDDPGGPFSSTFSALRGSPPARSLISGARDQEPGLLQKEGKRARRHCQLEPGRTLLLKFYVITSWPKPVLMSNSSAMTQDYYQILLRNPLNRTFFLESAQRFDPQGFCESRRGCYWVQQTISSARVEVSLRREVSLSSMQSREAGFRHGCTQLWAHRPPRMCAIFIIYQCVVSIWRR